MMIALPWEMPLKCLTHNNKKCGVKNIPIWVNIEHKLGYFDQASWVSQLGCWVIDAGLLSYETLDQIKRLEAWLSKGVALR